MHVLHHCDAANIGGFLAKPFSNPSLDKCLPRHAKAMSLSSSPNDPHRKIAIHPFGFGIWTAGLDQSTCSLTSSPSSNSWSKSLAFIEFYLLPSGTANQDNSNLIGSTNTHCRPVLVSKYANYKETRLPVHRGWRFKMQMQEDLWLICESGLKRKSFESCHLVDPCHGVRRHRTLLTCSTIHSLYRSGSAQSHNPGLFILLYNNSLACSSAT
jgi:hypothetical protein